MIGVIGAGNIGSSLVHNLIIEGKKVVLVDKSDEILQMVKKDISQKVRFTHLYLQNDIKYSPELISNIEFTCDLNRLNKCDIVIENVTEDYEIKKDIYVKIDAICKPDAIFGVNTSCISITKIGALTKRADKIIGTHFMNPVFLKDCVEVIKGYYTSDKTIQTLKSFLMELKKEAVVVDDYPGFVSNRISHLFMNEAIYTYADGVANPKEIDTIFKRCFSHKMGPLETADLIGLDTVYNSLLVLYESYRDSKYRPCPLLEKMVNAGLLGMKTGEGFYKY